MNTRMDVGASALTEKEKQTLRLIVRGHDAKSIARHLGLSVHTVNERLRDSRRKMAVSSSREAARLLFEIEQADQVILRPDKPGDMLFGEDAAQLTIDQGAVPVVGAGQPFRRPFIVAGAFAMTITLGLVALAMMPQKDSAPLGPSISTAPSSEVAVLARQWLGLLDQSRWEESYAATGAAFKQLNTLELWTSSSEQARSPLGAVIRRTFLAQESLPAPPAGYEVVKFRTSFVNKAEAIETVTFVREGTAWRVVGIFID